METPKSQFSDNDLDSAINSPIVDHDFLAELESLQQSYRALQSKSSTMEANLLLLQEQRDEAIDRYSNLTKLVDELSGERDSLRCKVHQLEASFMKKEREFEKGIEEESREKEKLKKEIDLFRERIDVLEVEKKEKFRFSKENMDSILSLKDQLVKIVHCLKNDDNDDENVVMEGFDGRRIVWELDEELGAFSQETSAALRLAKLAELKVTEYKEARKKEKRELENSVVSLTEENRDINSLLRIALVEKEAVEKSLNKLKGNSEQKRVALLQIAERSLQRVGFGFMMGSANNEQSLESSGATTTGNSRSDASECEEEAVSLASTVERIMKNLRLEITQLRKSLEDSRSDTERLQSLTEKQTQMIEENTLYIKELEDRERVLTQSVEELLIEIKETKEDVARWREACELEVEAGKKEIEERDKVIAILKQELEKTKVALEISNGKLKLKEELAATAMAAQAAAERSLQLADSRAAGLHNRIEELTRQLEEAESRERSRRKVGRICWPWRALKIANNTNTNTKRMLPEMQALLR